MAGRTLSVCLQNRKHNPLWLHTDTSRATRKFKTFSFFESCYQLQFNFLKAGHRITNHSTNQNIWGQNNISIRFQNKQRFVDQTRETFKPPSLNCSRTLTFFWGGTVFTRFLNSKEYGNTHTHKRFSYKRSCMRSVRFCCIAVVHS